MATLLHILRHLNSHPVALVQQTLSGALDIGVLGPDERLLRKARLLQLVLVGELLDVLDLGLFLALPVHDNLSRVTAIDVGAAGVSVTAEHQLDRASSLRLGHAGLLVLKVRRRALTRVAGVCVALELLRGNVPEVVARFVDPVTGVVLCARPAVAKGCESRSEGVDDQVSRLLVLGDVAFHPFENQFVVLVGAPQPGVCRDCGCEAKGDGKRADHLELNVNCCKESVCVVERADWFVCFLLVSGCLYVLCFHVARLFAAKKPVGLRDTELQAAQRWPLTR
jgi:hypothetical protein